MKITVKIGPLTGVTVAVFENEGVIHVERYGRKKLETVRTLVKKEYPEAEVVIERS